jgi:arylsulfatase
MKFPLLIAILALPVLAESKPNIVVILTDDMGWSDIGCYGSEIPTPNLDKLAAGGVRFTQFYNTARCCPTRASLLTGLYPHQAGVGHMTEDRGRDGYRGELNGRCVTIAEALRPAGYRNYALGKWHISRNTRDDGDKAAWPLQRGFDRYYGTITGAGNYFDPATLTRGNKNISAMADPEYQPERYYYTDALAHEAARFIGEHQRDHAGEPFFMYVAFTAAHWPLQAPEDEIARFKGKYDAGYEAIRAARIEKQKQLGLFDAKWQASPLAGDWAKVEHKDWEARCMEVYAAQVARMDAGVGRIVAELERDGLLENTLILYLQDNGGCAEAINRATKDTRADKPSLEPQPADFIPREVRAKRTRDGWPVLGGPLVMPGPADTYQSYGKGWANVSNTPFREYKHWVHEGGIGTPLIAHWPAGIVAKGGLNNRPGHLVDIMATCLDVSGAQFPSERAGVKVQPPEGVSLAPAFAEKALRRERPIFWEHEGNRALRMDFWKLVAKGPAGPWELYDISTDRTEQRDLASAEPERVKSMAALWESEARRTKVLPWIWKPQFGSGGAVAAGNDGEPELDDDATGSGATKFTLKSGDDLTSDKAPRLTGKGFSVVVDVPEPGNGVLVAQGGSTHGWALYVQDGTLHFAIRRAGKLSVVDGPALHVGKSAFSLAQDGSVRIESGKTAATARVPGPLTKHPQDGLQVGRDGNGLVGDYKAEFPFTGKIGGASIEILR